MKRQPLWLLVLTLCFAALSGCGGKNPQQEAERALNLTLPQAAQTARSDSHGGFLGDGELRICLTFDQAEANQVEQTISGTPGWQVLPMEESLSLMLYGGETESGYWQGFLESGTPEIPRCQSGYWYFQDRTPPGDSDAAPRNFTAAIYDTATRTLCLIVWDS
ncbi:MAG: hypothetical protein ACI3VN_08595 [Candidatus Onthomonas sp.]